MEKQNRKRVLIIIPAYNEAKNIGQLFENMRQAKVLEIADCVVINDGSRDDTSNVVKKEGIPVLDQVYNLGYGCALQTGYKYAIRNNYEYVIQMDADGQHDVCNIFRLYEALQKKDADGKYPDIVLGSRFLDKETDLRTSGMKKIAIGLFRFILRCTTHKKITDPTSGLQGLSHRTVAYYAGFEHFDDKYPDANMLIQMLLLGFRAEEIPALMHDRAEGTSMHSGLKPILYMCRMAICMIAAWVRVRILKIDKDIISE